MPLKILTQEKNYTNQLRHPTVNINIPKWTFLDVHTTQNR